MRVLTEEQKAQQKAYRETNSEKYKARAKAWREANPEKHKVKNKASCKAYYEANREKLKAKSNAIKRNLADSYVARRLGLPVDQVPPELLQAKREQLMLHRAIKEFNNTLSEVNSQAAGL